MGVKKRQEARTDMVGSPVAVEKRQRDRCGTKKVKKWTGGALEGTVDGG